MKDSCCFKVFMMMSELFSLAEDNAWHGVKM